MPGANSHEAFWQLISEGKDAIREVPPDRWDVEALYDPAPGTPGKMCTRWGGFIDDVDAFDCDFFGISRREAARMDPQQRLLLEVAWEALEDAGIPASALRGSRTGVFMGVSTYDYGARLSNSLDGDHGAYDATGAALSIVANRLSYYLDLRGPSLVVDTACSSSLVAFHLARQSLASGETELALVGGVNVIADPAITISLSQGGFMAADGRCKPFDHRADGYVRGEGVGVVVLKPLAQACANRDRVYAVALGSAVNHGGRSNGLVAPNRLAQEEALRTAYEVANVEPASVDYVEAHGTGTALGDPIEVAALASVLGGGRGDDRPLRVGSVKSNVGHLEAASGLAGLIKVALALYHGWLPPTLHVEQPNPMLGLDALPLCLQTEGEPWPEVPDSRRTAGLSSFGFGGANAHVVLVGPPKQEDHNPTKPVPALVPISARSEDALFRRAAMWARVSQDRADDPEWFAKAAASAALRYDHHQYRAAVVAADARGFAEGMDAVASGGSATVSGPFRIPQRPPRVAFVFPGQGSHWSGMGRQLALAVPGFRDAIHRSNEAVRRWLGRGLWDDASGFDAVGTEEIQPALFIMQVAIAETWRCWGVEPAAVVGHSVGEIAAAHVCGALSLEDAARLVCERSLLLAELTGSGGMAMVELDAEQTQDLIRGREHALSIAAVNGPRETVLAGEASALDDIVALLNKRGVFARRVAVEFAAHSVQVEPLQPRLRRAVEGLTAHDAAIPMYSTVTGELTTGRDLESRYWGRNLRAPVCFSSAIERLLEDGLTVLVEVAPHPVLARSLRDIADECSPDAAVIHSMRRDDELAGMLNALGEFFTLGVRVYWPAVYPSGAPHLALPGHGWEHEHFPVVPGQHADEGPGAPRRAITRRSPGQAESEAAGTALLDRIEMYPSADERLHLLSSRVAEVVAAVLRVTASEVDVRASFEELGLDSLRGIELRDRLEAETGMTVPAELLFERPTIDALCRGLLDQWKANQSGASGRQGLAAEEFRDPRGGSAVMSPNRRDKREEWSLHAMKPTGLRNSVSSRAIRCPRSQPAALVRLVCFPHAGGGPAAFHGWAPRLVPNIELWTVTLPGRADRANEPFAREWMSLIEDLAVEVGQVPPPLAFFGHSLGAAMAFELVRELARREAEAPIHLFVSGRGAPDSSIVWPVPESDEDLLRAVEGLYGGMPAAVKEEPYLRERFVRILRADAELANAYNPTPGPPIRCPITVLAGDADPTLPRESLEAWRLQTTDRCDIRVLPGGHFFLQRPDGLVLVMDTIRTKLAR